MSINFCPRNHLSGKIWLALCHYNMSQDNMIKLECTVCKTTNYHSHKNKKTLKERLEMNKYCNHCKKHTLHKETK